MTRKTKQKVTRRQAVFVTSIAAIAILFLISIVGILTGRLRPFANEVDPLTTANEDNRPRITLPGANLTYTDEGQTKTTTAGEVSVINPPYPSVVFELQGLGDLLTKLPFNSTGKMTVLDKNNAKVVDAASWTTNLNDSATDRKAVFKDETVLAALDASECPCKITLKVDGYLGKQANMPTIDDPVDLNRLEAGDFTGDNRVNGGDIAVLVPYLNSVRGDATTGARYTQGERFDLNRDGVINGGDIAIFVVNLGKTGTDL